MENRNDPYQQQYSSLVESKSKQDFTRVYKMYDEATRRGVYLQVLIELTKTISDGNVERFKKFSNFIEYMGDVERQVTLNDYYKNSRNPIRKTNIVILACKYNKIEILNSIFSYNRILDNLSINVGNDPIAPNDKDDTCHNAFYYAICSGDVKLLDTLIYNWPNNYFADRSVELEEVLSQCYQELKLKNVPLSDGIEMFVLNKLINLRFFSDSSVQIQCAKDDIKNIRERIKLLLEKINLLKTEYINEKIIDETFLFLTKFIAQNIYVLKRQLKSTYDRLPWEEMEFCLVSFVTCYLKRQEINLFYRSTLNKSRILNHLEHFAHKLEDVTGILGEVTIGNLSDLPKLRRENVISEIATNFPPFIELYKDHQQIRDNHSLMKINNYINLALSADPKQREGQLIITRALQVIGEYLKNTLESPKLSNTTSELLLLSLPKNTRKIIVDLRNSFSHAYALSKRAEIEENKDFNFFAGVQNDTKKVGLVVTDILYNNKIKIIRTLVETIDSSNNVDEIKEVVAVLSTVELDEMLTGNFKMIEHAKLEKLIKELSDNMTDKTNYEKEKFNRINNIIENAGDRSVTIQSDYITEYTGLKDLTISVHDSLFDHNTIARMKFRAKRILQNMAPKIEPHSIRDIAKLSSDILHSVVARMQCENFDEVIRLLFEILLNTQFRCGDIKYIEELRGNLNTKASPMVLCKENRAYNLKASEHNKQLALKLSELKDILSNRVSISNTNETHHLYKKDKKLQAVVEMLVLDILSIYNNKLENNLNFLDANAPLLIGKSLRNHLAHDNTLHDILLSDPSLEVILNAIKLTEEVDTMRSNRKIGKFVTDDPAKVKEKYKEDLANITLQERMFNAAEKGNLESFKDCLKQGADINARNNSSWTTLHFAAKGHSLKVIKFILDQKVSPNVVDINGQSPLHVAAAYGRENIVKFLLCDVDLVYVDVPDDTHKTPLHLAAQNGHKNTVEVLLENKANTTTQNFGGMTALHCAIRNNHIDVAKVLLAKDANVDINETWGGFTPLHEASKFGYVELVKFLLKNKADIKARNDYDCTPLHAAALYGHLEVVNALILKGADVKARSIDGSTPLHCATQNGHEQIVAVLLRNGADVNAVTKTNHFTALHYAAKDGYIGIVKIMLRSKANACVDTVDGITPLHLATMNNHLEIVTAFLEHGVKVQSKNNKITLLHLAAGNGRKEIVELLLQYGADVNSSYYGDLTPLHLAANEGHQDVADLLIRNEARVDAACIRGSTPLHAAAFSGSIHIIDVLMTNKCEVNPKTHEGIIPLHLAALNGHDTAVLLLIKYKADVDARTNCGVTPLQLAVEAGYKKIVEILLANGAQINVKRRDRTPLHIAIKSNNREIAEFLIASGANVNTGGLFEPLTVAVLAGRRDMVELLIKNKADVNARDAGNGTPLHVAAGRGYKDVANVLIKGGADVDAVATNNVTPLYVAAQEGYEEVVELLISHGADVNGTTIDGTPLHIAASCGHDSVVKVLINKGADINLKTKDNRTALELAVAHDHLEIVKILLGYKKVNVNIECSGTWTFLHIASQESNLEMVKYLVAEGCDINARNAHSSKAIHIAAKKGHKDIVEFFLSKGLSINEPGIANQTLLHYAAMNGQLEVVGYLIAEGADVNAQTDNGSSPMHLAASFGCKDVIEVLLKSGAFYNAVDHFHRRPLEMSHDENVINLLASTDKLFRAVKHNKLSQVESCIEAGAFVNAKNVDAVTPLHYAAWKGYDAVVNVLLQHNADPNAVTKDGSTSLHYAAKFSRFKIVLALLTKGAAYNAISDSGKSPLDLTTDNDISNLFQLVSESFDNIKKNSSKIINVLKRIKDVEIIKAIMGARNKEDETLVVTADHSNFSCLEQLKEISQGLIALQLNTAGRLANQGKYQIALDMLKSAFEKRKEILGANNPGTLDIQTEIAHVFYKQGFFEEALNTYGDICQKQIQELGLNNRATLSTRNCIALVLHRQGKNEEAFNTYQEVHQKQVEILGPHHSDTLNTLFNMALVLHAQEKYEEALNANSTVFQKWRDQLGPNDPLTVRAQNNIAMVLGSQGRYEEALRIYKEVVEKKKVVFGIHHSDTLRTLHNLAVVLLCQNKYLEALQTYQEVLSIQKSVLGPNHPETLTTQYSVANVLFSQGKLVSALKVYRECLNQMKSVFGPSHPHVLDTLEKLEKIKMNFKLGGLKESAILQHLQKEINIAACNDDTQTVQRLITDGADVNDKDSEGRTPLHFATHNRRLDVVNILLKAGADVTQVTHKGNTPLHTAASKGYKEIVDVLLQHVTRDKLQDFVNAKTTAGGTAALHVAVKSGHSEIVKCLLEHGAIFDVKNKEGKIPLDICTHQNITDLLKLIQELFKYAKDGSAEIVSQLKSMKSDEFLAVTSARNHQGNTLLLVVLINRHKNIASKLLEVLKASSLV